MFAHPEAYSASCHTDHSPKTYKAHSNAQLLLQSSSHAFTILPGSHVCFRINLQPFSAHGRASERQQAVVQASFAKYRDFQWYCQICCGERRQASCTVRADDRIEWKSYSTSLPYFCKWAATHAMALQWPGFFWRVAYMETAAVTSTGGNLRGNYNMSHLF